MSIIVWIVFGALAGWVASMIAGTNAKQGAVGNIVVGIVGAIVGGFIARLLGGSGVSGFNLTSLLIAIAGAVVVLFAYNAFTKSSTTRG